MTPQELCDIISSGFTDAIQESKPDATPDPWVKIRAERLKEVSLLLRDDERTSFDVLMCLTGMDYTGGKLGVVYHLHSMKWNHKLVLKVELPAEEPHVPSVESVWKTANWHEREAYDLYGIIFDGHPDLRRILLPDDWDGHPLRKDYQVQEFYNGMKVPY